MEKAVATTIAGPLLIRRPDRPTHYFQSKDPTVILIQYVAAEDAVAKRAPPFFRLHFTAI